MERLIKIYAVLLCSFGTIQAAQASSYQLFLETDANAGAGDEVFGATYDAYANLLASTTSSTGFSTINIASDFSIAGLAYDGKYQLLLETDANTGAGAEVFGVTYDTYADLLANSASSTGFSSINIAPDFSIAGLAYDGKYQLLLETNANTGAGDEVFGVTYDTYADLLANSASSTGFSSINIAPSFSIGGLAYDGFPVPPVAPTVPVPAAVWLFGSGLIGLIGVARRKKA